MSTRRAITLGFRHDTVPNASRSQVGIIFHFAAVSAQRDCAIQTFTTCAARRLGCGPTSMLILAVGLQGPTRPDHGHQHDGMAQLATIAHQLATGT